MGKLIAILLIGVAGYFVWQHFKKPEPEKRLAPPGVYYVVKAFSLEVEDGLHSFPILKKVRLVREENGTFFVTDEKVEASAPAENFTNDLDEVDKIRNTLPKPTPIPAVDQPPTDAEKKVKRLNQEIKALKFENENFELAIKKLREIKDPGIRNISAEIAEIESKIRSNNLLIDERRLAIRKIEENL